MTPRDCANVDGDDLPQERRFPPKKRRCTSTASGGCQAAPTDASADGAPTAALTGGVLARGPQWSHAVPSGAVASGPRWRPAGPSSTLTGARRWRPVNNFFLGDMATSPPTPHVGCIAGNNNSLGNPASKRGLSAYSNRVCNRLRCGACACACACATPETDASASSGVFAEWLHPAGHACGGHPEAARCSYVHSSVQGAHIPASSELQQICCGGAHPRPTRTAITSCRGAAHAATTCAATPANIACHFGATEMCGGIFVSAAAGRHTITESGAATGGPNCGATAHSTCGGMVACADDTTTSSVATTFCGTTTGEAGSEASAASRNLPAEHNRIGFSELLGMACNVPNELERATVENWPLMFDEKPTEQTVAEGMPMSHWKGALQNCIESILKSSSLREAVFSNLFQICTSILCGVRIPSPVESESGPSAFPTFAQRVRSWFTYEFWQRGLSASLATYLNGVVEKALQKLRRFM